MIVINYVVVINGYEIVPEYRYDNAFMLCEDRVVYNKDGTFNRVRIEENIFVNISKTKTVRKVRMLLKELIGNILR